MPRSAARRDPSPERVRAVGTVPGAVQSPRLAGRPPLSKWPRVSRVAGHSGRVAGGLQRLRRPFFGQNWVAGAISGPKATDFDQKMATEGADGQAALEIRRPRRI